MRSLRSPRKSALRVTAAAASGIFAIAVLAGCNGDDKDKAPNGLDISMPPMTMPSIKIPDIDVPDIDVDGTSTGSSTATSTKKPTGTPTQASDGASLPDEVESVDLEVGECINTSSSGEISKTSCSGSHDAQVSGVTEIPDGGTPGTSAFDDANEATCERLSSALIKRQSNASDLTFTWYSPTLASWTQGDRTLQCMIVRQDETKLTAKLT